MMSTRKEADLQTKLHAQQRRTRFERRRADELFVQLTEATRQLGLMKNADPEAAAFVDMQGRAATLATALQALINQSRRIAGRSTTAADYAQSVLDSAGTVVKEVAA
ncbi:hypothetical protein [Schauerella aestuarii]|uniref:hypothetical protein n=1 Tax=Schauerella aestuarii TaxID=2511204 RepID=UPI00137112BF|nr:hypothetical protein [Achromobacter aestuarii]MYZ44186.1 hypothetical protein [Achromobacter aestuarii]